jgi:hypothetical protein
MGMMAWPSRKRRLRMARHGIALTVLLSFAVGNIGWPVTAGNGQCRTLAGKSMCCCGDKAKVGNCGCCKGSVASANTGRGCCDSDPKSAPVKLASCCQKKKQKLEPAHNLALKCACGDSPLPGFLVSSQPKLQTPPMRMPDLAKTAVVSSPMTRAVQQGSLSPETPPPRPSVA